MTEKLQKGVFFPPLLVFSFFLHLKRNLAGILLLLLSFLVNHCVIQACTIISRVLVLICEYICSVLLAVSVVFPV
ncbi:hypothetical protein BDA99DRAFT_227688 [Phascolomyces articulosus]|uniref:Uncharacterized protein n=1 Tax=Phascolomyces articulosus TaxID=60185 RepID=A0AAD5JQE6_9FUNG|nr:hypothetical protein BDA99DRAFT_227688 [Phascolomyces articulosus]